LFQGGESEEEGRGKSISLCRWQINLMENDNPHWVDWPGSAGAGSAQDDRWMLKHVQHDSFY